jgi:hypothetical protein
VIGQQGSAIIPYIRILAEAEVTVASDTYFVDWIDALLSESSRAASTPSPLSGDCADERPRFIHSSVPGVAHFKIYRKYDGIRTALRPTAPSRCQLSDS